MKVIYGIGKVKKLEPSVAAIGVFDGVHVGHQALIRKAAARAKAVGSLLVVVTFHPHPVHVLRPEIHLPLITSLSHRLALLEELGVDICIVIRFNRRFSHLSAQRFVKRYLVEKVNAREIFVGDDFRFGENRSGTPADFEAFGKKYDFRVHVLSAVGGRRSEGGRRKNIGSSVIRERLSAGKLNDVRKLLGRPVSIMGRVVKGDGRGKQLGFPTANIIPEHELIPPVGVYAVRIHLHGKVFNGMANIGRRPSFPAKHQSIHIEVHIFNFRRNIYGQTVTLDIIKKIRSEKIFPSTQALVDQLQEDRTKALHIFA